MLKQINNNFLDNNNMNFELHKKIKKKSIEIK